jgi:hypothetical protein
LYKTKKCEVKLLALEILHELLNCYLLFHLPVGYLNEKGSGHALQDPPEWGNDLIRAEALEAVREFIFAIE